jgi:hypothetical protein
MGFAFSKEIFLKRVRITSPSGVLHADTVGPFFPSYVQSEGGADKGIASSVLARLLDIEPHTAEVDEIFLTPQRSELRFQLEGSARYPDSEAFFHCGLTRSIDCRIEIGGGEARVHSFRFGSPLSGYVRCVSSNLKLSEHKSELRVGLSLFLRRRSFLHFIRDGKTVSINLATPDSALSYGLLVDNPQNHKEVLQKLLSYAPRRQLYFLVEAFSNPGALEVRLLNALVHLEIIDGGRRLSANRLATVFGVTREGADAIVHFRNAMIHDGLNARQALEESRSRVSSKSDRQSKVRILDEALQEGSPHGSFYCALMDLLSTHLANEADIPTKWVKRRVTLSFYEH